MPRKKKINLDNKLQEKLDYLELDLDKLPKNLKEYTDINFRTIKGYDEKKYKQYRFINVEDIEILLSPTNRVDSIKEKYEEALPLAYYLDNKNEENFANHTKFLQLLDRVSIYDIEKVEEEQKKISKNIPFKIKYTGNYLWQIYYSKTSEKYFMIVPTEDSDYSTFFYLLKKKIENKPNEKIFVPISLVDYDGKILPKDEIKDIENYLWLFTKDYPLIYEMWNKKDEESLNIIGETEIYDNIKTLYKIQLSTPKEALKFYKFLKALFILQTEIPHHYKFDTNIDKNAGLEFYYENTKIEYEILPEFIYEQYLKSISLKNKAQSDFEELNNKIIKLQIESEELTREYSQKEKQITTYLECKKTFFGKVKYFFKFGKKSKTKEKDIISENTDTAIKKKRPSKKEKFKLEEKNYTLFELEESFKELEEQEEKNKNLVMDINALKLKNKNLKKKIENATNYIEEINKHKKSIFEFWRYSNKDAVATLSEGEEEEINVKKIEKIFNFENDFEDFGYEADKLQRNKFTDDELDSAFIASTNILPLLNRMKLKIAENKEISEELKELKVEKEKHDEINIEDEDFNIFGKIKQTSNKERTLGNKVHRELPRDKYEILEIKKGLKGIELKRNLEKTLKNLKSAFEKNELNEDMYVYKATSEKIELDTMQTVSLDGKDEIEKFIKEQNEINKIYLYKIKLPKGTNYIAYTNIIFFDNKNMTLPIGMNLSNQILIDLSNLDLKEVNKKKLSKIEFEDEDDDFSKIIIKDILVKELETEK